jgi:hypothetical protein
LRSAVADERHLKNLRRNEEQLMPLHLKFAGFNYVADVDGSYADANSLPSMISETDSNSVALTDDYGIDAATSTIYADYNTPTTTGNTETLANLTNTIKSAEADGLTVMVRPLVDFTADASQATLRSSDGTQYEDGDWRASYVPTNTTAFFNSYDTMIVAEATAAQAGGAQLFDIGTELDQLTGPQYLSEWTKIISDVRAVFSGQLTYSAVSDDDLSSWQYGGGHPAAGTGDIATQVSFWSQLDYVGIDEYAAISDAHNGGANPDPTLQQLIAGWEDTPTDPTTKAMTGGLSLIQYYENISAETGKPLLFTEIGYESAPDAASQPFFTSSNTYDPTLQANLYKAFFTAWQDQGNTSLKGVYIWNWEPDPATVGAGDSPNWTPQDNTGSLEAVQAGFSDSIACYVTGTRISTFDGHRAVESLEIGDLVMTMSGVARPVKWIGRRSYGGRFVMGRKDILPICIKAGALDDQLPTRDLWISPHHAMYLQGVLIEARDLVNGVSIFQAEQVEKVEYFHIELDSHDVISAEGALSETFIDDDSRGMFHNAHEYGALYPCAAQGAACYCAPRRSDGYEMEAARRGINARAGLLHSSGSPQAGPLRGFVDLISGRSIAGWAQNLDHRDAPVCLDVFADGVLIGQILASRYRGDLERAGIGNGAHAFEFTPPQGSSFADIEVRRSFDGAALRLSSKARHQPRQLQAV